MEFVPAQLKVIEHVRFKYACRSCQEHVAIAPPPHKPINKGLPGPGLLSAIVVGKYADHLPLYRLEDVLARQGVVFSRSTLCRWALRTADILEPLTIGRKNWMFLGSDTGGKAAAILYGVIASAQLNQVEPFAYVRDLLRELSGDGPDDLSELLPDIWLKTHPESHRRWSR